MTSYDSAVGRERGNPLREPFALLANHTAASPARKMPPRKLGNFDEIWWKKSCARCKAAELEKQHLFWNWAAKLLFFLWSKVAWANNNCTIGQTTLSIVRHPFIKCLGHQCARGTLVGQSSTMDFEKTKLQVLEKKTVPRLLPLQKEALFCWNDQIKLFRFSSPVLQLCQPIFRTTFSVEMIKLNCFGSILQFCSCVSQSVQPCLRLKLLLLIDT